MFDTGKTISIGDTEIFVAEAGRPDAAPIVLLHGGLGSRDDFGPLARLLAADHRLIAIDSRGHGRSGLGMSHMTYRQLTEDVTEVLTQLDLEDAGIIGHSDGGIVALRLAASGLMQPRFVVAVGAHWHLPTDDPLREVFQAMTVEKWRSRFPEQVRQYHAESPAPDFPRLFETVISMWLSSGEDAYPGSTIRAITSPLLVIRGDEDAVVSRDQAVGLAEQVEGARLLNLPYADHFLLEEIPEEILPALTRFMRAAQNGSDVS